VNTGEAQSKELAMKPRTLFKATTLALVLPVLMLADLAPQAPLGLSLTRDAAAIIGRPFTPMSYAGVARRTTRRFVAFDAAATTAAVATTSTAVAQQQAVTAQQQAATAQQQAATAQQQAAVAQQQARTSGAPPIGAIVHSLPAGCVSAPQGGIEYYRCGNVFYRTAFQGANLVYVVAQP